MKEKISQQPTQNLQMMTTEQHKEVHSVNIVTRSGATTGEDSATVQKPMEDTCVKKAGDKNTRFNMKK